MSGDDGPPADRTPGEIVERAGVASLGGDELSEWPKGVDEPVLVAFLAPWCEVSFEAASALGEVAERLAGRAALRHVDTDRSAMATERLGVRSVPALVLYAGEREVARRICLGSADELIAFAERAMTEAAPESDSPAEGPAQPAHEPKDEGPEHE